MIYFISDTHFFHSNIISYCSRPFKTVEEMNLIMIYRWNSVVSSDDIVIFGGDFALTSPEKARNIMNSLNGINLTVKGNYDRSLSYLMRIGFRDVLIEVICLILILVEY